MLRDSMPSLPESLLKWSPGLCAQGKGSRKRTARFGRNLMTSQKDSCQFVPRQGTHPGNGTGCGLPGWGQPCGKGLGGQGAGEEAAVCPGSKGGHQHPGLDDQQHSQVIEGRVYTEYCVQISDPSIGKMSASSSQFRKGPPRWSGAKALCL